MDTDQFLNLLERYEQGVATADEEETLLDLLAEETLREEIGALLLERLEITKPETIVRERWAPVLEGILQKERPVRRLRWWLSAAAVLLLVAGAAIFFIHRPSGSPVTAGQVVHDISAPSVNRARITLDNGQAIYLDSVGNGQLASQGNAQLVKLGGGQVAYRANAGSADETKILYNILTNPRGSQVIALTLTDGSKVWLNTESSIRYPTIFGGRDRVVEVTGEAYFEVAENASHPFIVRKGGTEVAVLGTHFNINAYDDEAIIRVTLLEGSVSVKRDEKVVVLEAGQQAQVGTSIRVDKNADLATVMAWKNGLFSFNDVDLHGVMRQLSRWYDVGVRYEGSVPDRVFYGKMRNSLTLSQVLGILTQYKVHYTIDDRHQITIRP